MALFASEELRGNYGWLLLGAEPVCFLVGEGNRLFGCGEADLADIAAQEVVCGGSPAYESWYAALPTVFLREGCALSLKAVPDAALDGGAYPVGSKRLCLCTERFASYYADLGVETVEPLRVRGLSPEVHSFAVFRRDNVNALVQRIASCSERG